MRIGLALYGSLEDQSGGFRYDRRLVRQLRAAGDTVEVINLPWRSYPRGLLDNLSPSLSTRLDGGFDVLLQDELAHPSLVRANRTVTAPVVSIVHHLRADENRRFSALYRAVEREYFAGVDAAVCNSEATRAAVCDTGDLSDGETLVAPPAGDRFDPDVDAEEITTRARRTRDEPLQVVFVGNVTPRKGLETLVTGLAAVDDDWELTVVGRAPDEEYRDRVQTRAVTAGCEDRVEFTGRIPDAELADVLRSGHVFAMPSRHEGFGIVYLEGMAFGLPAVATTAGGATEVVTDGENGILVDPDDPGGVTAAIDSLAGDPERLAEMSLAARRRFENHPDWTVTGERVRSFLLDVAEARSTEVVS